MSGQGNETNNNPAGETTGQEIQMQLAQNVTKMEDNFKDFINKTVSGAKQKLDQATKDKRRSDYCNLAGNIIIFGLLLAYFIYAWVEYADTSSNRQTIVSFSPTKTLKMPVIFFQNTEYGNLEEVKMTLYDTSCKVTADENGQNLSFTTLYNPTPSMINEYEKDWLLVNTTLSSYNYSGYGCDSRRRMSYSYYEENVTYDGYSFSSYNASYYCSSSSSNIYYVIPPSNPVKYIETNQHKRCGDVFRLTFKVSVPDELFSSKGYSWLDQLLYVRSFPDSFGFEYGFDSRDIILKSYSNKEHVYYSGRLPFGETKSEELQLLIADDKVDGSYFEYYESQSSLDFSNLDDNVTYVDGPKLYFICNLYVYAEDFLVEYKTIQKTKWYAVFSQIGGMYGTIATPVVFFLAAWLYGFSLLCIKLEARAPLDPLPEDLLKRMDGFIAAKILEGELARGPKWEERDTIEA